MACITPTVLFAKFHGEEVREHDLENLLNRAVRREVVNQCLEIFNVSEKERAVRIDKLIRAIETFPIAFALACKEANIFPPKELTFDIAANLTILSNAIEKIGSDPVDDKLFQFSCKLTHADDDLWIEMGLAFIEHDTEKGVDLLVNKNDEITRLIDECEEMWSEVPPQRKKIIREKIDELVESFEFFSSP